jgi:hypothetical protein
MMQAKLYLITHSEKVQHNYADYICKQLCQQDPNVKRSLYGEDETKSELSYSLKFGRHAILFLLDYIMLCDDMLILFHPKDKEPSVVVDAYTFFDIAVFESQIKEVFEKQIMEEYINSDKENPGSGLAKEAASRTVRFGTGYGMNKAGAFLTKTGNRLSVLSKHYASGHSSMMRVTRSIRGKKRQQEALMSLYKKSARYGKLAVRSQAAGGMLKWSATKLMKGALKPVSILAVFNVSDMGMASLDYNNKVTAEQYLPEALAAYCEKHNNYRMIIDQKYFEQG